MSIITIKQAINQEILAREIYADLVRLIRRQNRMENHLNEITPDLQTIFELTSKGIDPYSDKANQLCRKLMIIESMTSLLWRQYHQFKPRACYIDIVHEALKEE